MLRMKTSYVVLSWLLLSSFAQAHTVSPKVIEGAQTASNDDEPVITVTAVQPLATDRSKMVFHVTIPKNLYNGNDPYSDTTKQKVKTYCLKSPSSSCNWVTATPYMAGYGGYFSIGAKDESGNNYKIDKQPLIPFNGLYRSFSGDVTPSGRRENSVVQNYAFDGYFVLDLQEGVSSDKLTFNSIYYGEQTYVADTGGGQLQIGQSPSYSNGQYDNPITNCSTPVQQSKVSSIDVSFLGSSGQENIMNNGTHTLLYRVAIKDYSGRIYDASQYACLYDQLAFYYSSQDSTGSLPSDAKLITNTYVYDKDHPGDPKGMPYAVTAVLDGENTVARYPNGDWNESTSQGKIYGVKALAKSNKDRIYAVLVTSRSTDKPIFSSGNQMSIGSHIEDVGDASITLEELRSAPAPGQRKIKLNQDKNYCANISNPMYMKAPDYRIIGTRVVLEPSIRSFAWGAWNEKDHFMMQQYIGYPVDWSDGLGISGTLNAIPRKLQDTGFKTQYIGKELTVFGSNYEISRVLSGNNLYLSLYDNCGRYKNVQITGKTEYDDDQQHANGDYKDQYYENNTSFPVLMRANNHFKESGDISAADKRTFFGSSAGVWVYRTQNMPSYNKSGGGSENGKPVMVKFKKFTQAKTNPSSYHDDRATYINRVVMNDSNSISIGDNGDGNLSAFASFSQACSDYFCTSKNCASVNFGSWSSQPSSCSKSEGYSKDNYTSKINGGSKTISFGHSGDSFTKSNSDPNVETFSFN